MQREKKTTTTTVITPAKGKKKQNAIQVSDVSDITIQDLSLWYSSAYRSIVLSAPGVNGNKLALLFDRQYGYEQLPPIDECDIRWFVYDHMVSVVHGRFATAGPNGHPDPVKVELCENFMLTLAGLLHASSRVDLNVLKAFLNRVFLVFDLRSTGHVPSLHELSEAVADLEFPDSSPLEPWQRPFEYYAAFQWNHLFVAQIKYWFFGEWNSGAQAMYDGAGRFVNRDKYGRPELFPDFVPPEPRDGCSISRFEWRKACDSFVKIGAVAEVPPKKKRLVDTTRDGTPYTMLELEAPPVAGTATQVTKPMSAPVVMPVRRDVPECMLRQVPVSGFPMRDYRGVPQLPSSVSPKGFKEQGNDDDANENPFAPVEEETKDKEIDPAAGVGDFGECVQTPEVSANVPPTPAQVAGAFDVLDAVYGDPGHGPLDMGTGPIYNLHTNPVLRREAFADHAFVRFDRPDPMQHTLPTKPVAYKAYKEGFSSGVTSGSQKQKFKEVWPYLSGKEKDRIIDAAETANVEVKHTPSSLIDYAKSKFRKVWRRSEAKTWYDMLYAAWQWVMPSAMATPFVCIVSYAFASLGALVFGLPLLPVTLLMFLCTSLFGNGAFSVSWTLAKFAAVQTVITIALSTVALLKLAEKLIINPLKPRKVDENGQWVGLNEQEAVLEQGPNGFEPKFKLIWNLSKDLSHHVRSYDAWKKLFAEVYAFLFSRPSDLHTADVSAYLAYVKGNKPKVELVHLRASAVVDEFCTVGGTLYYIDKKNMHDLTSFNGADTPWKVINNLTYAKSIRLSSLGSFLMVAGGVSGTYACRKALRDLQNRQSNVISQIEFDNFSWNGSYMVTCNEELDKDMWAVQFEMRHRAVLTDTQRHNVKVSLTQHMQDRSHDRAKELQDRAQASRDAVRYDDLMRREVDDVSKRKERARERAEMHEYRKDEIKYSHDLRQGDSGSAFEEQQRWNAQIAHEYEADMPVLFELYDVSSRSTKGPVLLDYDAVRALWTEAYTDHQAGKIVVTKHISYFDRGREKRYDMQAALEHMSPADKARLEKFLMKEQDAGALPELLQSRSLEELFGDERLDVDFLGTAREQGAFDTLMATTLGVTVSEKCTAFSSVFGTWWQKFRSTRCLAVLLAFVVLSIMTLILVFIWRLRRKTRVVVEQGFDWVVDYDIDPTKVKALVHGGRRVVLSPTEGAYERAMKQLQRGLRPVQVGFVMNDGRVIHTVTRPLMDNTEQSVLVKGKRGSAFISYPKKSYSERAASYAAARQRIGVNGPLDKYLVTALEKGATPQSVSACLAMVDSILTQAAELGNTEDPALQGKLICQMFDAVNIGREGIVTAHRMDTEIAEQAHENKVDNMAKATEVARQLIEETVAAQEQALPVPQVCNGVMALNNLSNQRAGYTFMIRGKCGTQTVKHLVFNQHFYRPHNAYGLLRNDLLALKVSPYGMGTPPAAMTVDYIECGVYPEVDMAAVRLNTRNVLDSIPSYAFAILPEGKSVPAILAARTKSGEPAPQGIMVRREKGVLYYTCDNEKGLCGCPILWENRVGGFHKAVITEGSRECMGQAFTPEIIAKLGYGIDQAAETFDPESAWCIDPAPIYMAMGKAIHAPVESDTHLYHYDAFKPKYVYNPAHAKSNIVADPWYERYCEQAGFTERTPMLPAQLTTGAFVKQMAYMATPQPEFPSLPEDDAVENLLFGLLVDEGLAGFQEISLNDAINGSEARAAFDKSTSVGFGFGHNYRTTATWIEKDADSFIKFAELDYEAVSRGTPIAWYLKKVMKDELRDVERVMLEKTRVYDPVSKPAFITSIRLTGELMERVRAKGQNPGSNSVFTGGMSIYRLGWDKMMRYMCFDDEGKLLYAHDMDVSMWDKLQAMQFIWRNYVMAARLAAYPGTPQSAELARKIMVNGIRHIRALWALDPLGFVCLALRGFWSGDFMTFFFNSIGQVRIFMYGFLRYVEGVAYTLADFRRCFKLKTCGDDTGCGSQFKHLQFVIDCYALFGWVASYNGDNDQPVENVEDVKFMGHTSIFVPLNIYPTGDGVWLPMLPWDKVLAICDYRRTGNTTEEVCIQAAHAGLIKAFPYQWSSTHRWVYEHVHDYWEYVRVRAQDTLAGRRALQNCPAEIDIWELHFGELYIQFYERYRVYGNAIPQSNAPRKKSNAKNNKGSKPRKQMQTRSTTRVVGTGTKATQAKKAKKERKQTFLSVGSDMLGRITLNNGTVANTLIWEQPINPRLFLNSRLATESLTWEKYRIKRLTFHLAATSGTNTNGTAVAYFETDPMDPTPEDPMREAYAHRGEKPLNLWEHKDVHFPTDRFLTDLYIAPNGADLRFSQAGKFRFVYGGGADTSLAREIYVVSMSYEILFINQSLDTTAELGAQSIVDFAGGYVGGRWTSNPEYLKNDLGTFVDGTGAIHIPSNVLQSGNLQCSLFVETDNKDGDDPAYQNTATREFIPKIELSGGGGSFEIEPKKQVLKAVTTSVDEEPTLDTITWVLKTTGLAADTIVKITNAATYASLIAIPHMRLMMNPTPKLAGPFAKYGLDSNCRVHHRSLLAPSDPVGPSRDSLNPDVYNVFGQATLSTPILDILRDSANMFAWGFNPIETTGPNAQLQLFWNSYNLLGVQWFSVRFYVQPLTTVWVQHLSTNFTTPGSLWVVNNIKDGNNPVDYGLTQISLPASGSKYMILSSAGVSYPEGGDVELMFSSNTTVLETGATFDCWIYLYPSPGGDLSKDFISARRGLFLMENQLKGCESDGDKKDKN